MMLAEFKRLANKRDVPYPSFLKFLITERLEEELWGSESKRAEASGNSDADTVGRTIWHSIYDIDARRIDVSFFVGDNPDGTDRRSPYESFKLAR